MGVYLTTLQHLQQVSSEGKFKCCIMGSRQINDFFYRKLTEKLELATIPVVVAASSFLVVLDVGYAAR